MPTSNLASRSILVCVCGGIAAYKVADLVSKLAQAKASVTVAMTAEAQKFVGPSTFRALSANTVYTDLWDHLEGKDPQHIRLAQHADIIVVAPCTANTLAKMANGLADDLVSTILLASDPHKILVAPAMNEGMWNHPATQRNAKRVFDDGAQFVGPAEGWQACRTIGAGRMSEPAEILQAIESRLTTLTPAANPPHFSP
ncbi:MAG TPA: flavoprotein [Phycisphaerae bacterium]|nr:flavoprotein [Phycisphaerae bacterium]